MLTAKKKKHIEVHVLLISKDLKHEKQNKLEKVYFEITLSSLDEMKLTKNIIFVIYLSRTKYITC